MDLSSDLVKLLPDSVVELIGLIGMENTFVLVKHYGGTHLDIPKKPRLTHWLVDVIGFETFEKLCYQYGSTKLELARCTVLLRAVKQQTILKEFNSGMSNAQLARKYQTTERHIRKIKLKIRQEKQVNLDLFGEYLG